MNKLYPVIIFGDVVTAYGVIRALCVKKIPIYMVTATGKGFPVKSRFICDSLVLGPSESNFIHKLNLWIKRTIGKKAVLMVTSDGYLDALAKGARELLPGIKTTFPDWGIVSLVRKKRLTIKIAKELGVPTPKTHYISSFSELKNLLSEGIKIDYPLLMRPEGSGKASEKKFRGILCHNKNEILKNYEKYNDGFAGKMFLQEMIPGGEENLFSSLIVLNKDSQPTGIFINKKRRSTGQFGTCTLMASTWSNDVLNYSIKLLQKIGYYGYANVEFKLDKRDGLFKIMEINGRISMSNSHALRCGINLPYLMYQEALCCPFSPAPDFKQNYPDNILWWYFLIDIVFLIKNKVFMQPIKCLKSLIGRGYILEPVSFRDPYPFLYSIVQIFDLAIQEIKQKLSKKKNN